MGLGVEVRREALVGRVVVRRLGSKERRDERRDGGRERIGGVGWSVLAMMDVCRVTSPSGGDSGVERADGEVSASLSGILVVSTWPLGRGDCFETTFCFFFWSLRASTDGDAAAFESARFLFRLLPADLVPLAVGELLDRLRLPNAFPIGLKRFRKADPISPSLRAAASASAAACEACSRACVSLLSFFASFSFIPRLRTVAASPEGVSTFGPPTLSRDLSRLSISTNLVRFARASAFAL